MSSQLLRQDFVPMVAGYVIVLTALGIGLRLHLRSSAAARGPAAAPVPQRAARTGRAGGGRLARHVAGTAVGGYLLLMLVVIGYYYGVARVGGAFIKSAFTGCAMLIGLAAPVFAVLSWLTGRRLTGRGFAGRGPDHSGGDGVRSARRGTR